MLMSGIMRIVQLKTRAAIVSRSRVITFSPAEQLNAVVTCRRDSKHWSSVTHPRGWQASQPTVGLPDSCQWYVWHLLAGGVNTALPPSGGPEVFPAPTQAALIGPRRRICGVGEAKGGRGAGVSRDSQLEPVL